MINWVTVIWSVVSGVSLALGAAHLAVWCWDRRQSASLWFSAAAVSISIVAILELCAMHARSPEEFLLVHRWGHVAVFGVVAGLVGFVQAYFGTGRGWLAWTLVALRAQIAVLAFFPGPTFNFREVTALLPFELLGETVVVPEGAPAPWARLGESTILLLVVFVMDASWSLWKTGGVGERRRALMVGGGVALFLLACMLNALLIHTGSRPMPYFISFSFMFVIVAMGLELSRDLVRAGRMAEELRAAEIEAGTLRGELAHLARVNVLGELSTSLAHEINQPLGIILSNAQAAQRLIAQSPPDLAEVRAILDDIVMEDRRAGEVIRRLRLMLRREEMRLGPLSLNEAITDVLRLMSRDMETRGITISSQPAPDMPEIAADRVQLQQVLMNLLLNAAEAVQSLPPERRRVHLTSKHADGRVRVSVSDEGDGLPADVEALFAPFFTTKPDGLGMGLGICRSIINAHGGRLWAEPLPERGAKFVFEIPVRPANGGHAA